MTFFFPTECTQDHTAPTWALSSSCTVHSCCSTGGCLQSKAVEKLKLEQNKHKFLWTRVDTTLEQRKSCLKHVLIALFWSSLF